MGQLIGGYAQQGELLDGTGLGAGKTRTRLTFRNGEASVLVRSLNLQPSAKGKRLLFAQNVLQVIDGPFSESKELIGGFAVMEVSGLDEILEICARYGEIQAEPSKLMSASSSSR
ncbi:MAG: YciI family protein [Acidimicrobiia bacterium]